MNRIVVGVCTEFASGVGCHRMSQGQLKRGSVEIKGAIPFENKLTGRKTKPLKVSRTPESTRKHLFFCQPDTDRIKGSLPILRGR